MQMWIRTSVAAAMLAALASAASATVLSFDDLGADGTVPFDYGGLDWSAGGWFAYGEPQEPFAAHSGDYRATTDFGADDGASMIRFHAPTTFEGAYFAGLTGALLSFKLYLGDMLVATSALLDPTGTPAFLSSGYTGLVDGVVISSSEHGAFVMDDFTFASAVPEPHTYTLMLGGLVAAAAFTRRRRRG